MFWLLCFWLRVWFVCWKRRVCHKNCDFFSLLDGKSVDLKQLRRLAHSSERQFSLPWLWLANRQAVGLMATRNRNCKYKRERKGRGGEEENKPREQGRESLGLLYALRHSC